MSKSSNNTLEEKGRNGLLSAEQVATYLSQHPDFFQQHTEILKHLSIPHAEDSRAVGTGQTVSLIERQVQSLRDENKQLKHQLNKLIGNAQTNDALFDKARALVLQLISTRSLDPLKHIVEKAMHKDFGSDYCCLWFITDNQDGKPDTKALPQITEQIPRLTRKGHVFCGVLKQTESEFLFADNADNVGSAAILPLYYGKELVAILAIANKDEGYYRNNMSTVLLEHIGQVMAQIIAQHSADDT